MFETYCLLLCKEIELSTNHDLRSCTGKGMERVFRFLRLVGVAIDDIRYKEEITSILQLRNCAYHAVGLFGVLE